MKNDVAHLISQLDPDIPSEIFVLSPHPDTAMEERKHEP
jgi:hypothetical protein